MCWRLAGQECMVGKGSFLLLISTLFWERKRFLGNNLRSHLWIQAELFRMGIRALQKAVTLFLSVKILVLFNATMTLKLLNFNCANVKFSSCEWILNTVAGGVILGISLLLCLSVERSCIQYLMGRHFFSRVAFYSLDIPHKKGNKFQRWLDTSPSYLVTHW